MSNLSQTVMTAFARMGIGEDVEQALQRAAKAHADPEFEARIDHRRAELATRGTDELQQLAQSQGFERIHEERAFLIEHLARHLAAQELQVERLKAELEGVES